jgi:hypothetical protein
MSRLIFRYEESNLDHLDREVHTFSSENIVMGTVPGKIPLQRSLAAFATFLKGCGYDIETLTYTTADRTYQEIALKVDNADGN